MTNRRTFLLNSGLAAAVARSAAGANDRIRVGVIGTGARGRYLAPVFAANADCEVVAICDVFKPNRERTAGLLPGKPELYVDYRRVLERKDIDAVLIATPDHWHAPMTIEACQAGKDAYCEKPVSNSIDAAQKAVKAVARYNRVVQIGLQQRSWDHFQMCREWVRDGRLGQIYHAQLHWQGTYTLPPEAPCDPPADLDWELFQGPAPRKPYSPGRQRGWRSFYDYGGGIITDQGVHLADVVTWYLNAGAPRSVSASAQWVRVTPPNPEQPPDTYSISWQYENFIMSFANIMWPLPDCNNEHGVYFYGTTGAFHVSRMNYTLRPLPSRQPSNQQAPPPAAFEAVHKSFPWAGEPADRAHVRNFLDCVKSRQKPLTGVEVGFNSTLPLLLGVLACKTGKRYIWNGNSAVARG